MISNDGVWRMGAHQVPALVSRSTSLELSLSESNRLPSHDSVTMVSVQISLLYDYT